jgi:hypothetical protein
MSDDDIRQILTDYEDELAEATAALRKRRAERLQAALDSGRTQADLIRATGKSREAIRQALNPAIAAAAAEAKRGARAAGRTP